MDSIIEGQRVIHKYEKLFMGFSDGSTNNDANRLASLRRLISNKYPWYWMFKYEGDVYWAANCLCTVLTGNG